MSLKKLASLIVKISANGAQAQAEFRKLEANAEKFGESMKRIGNNMTKYVTVPLAGIAVLSVKAANTQLQAEAKLLNALKGREDVQKRLMAQASQTQSRTLFGDEEIIEQQAYLAALGLSEQQINDTIEAAVQLSAALGMDLTSAVKNLAKTYGGMTGELGESIPALKNFTQEQLKAGDAIGYVNANYKGFAESAAETGAGPLVQLKNKLGDLAEKVGTILIPILEKVVVVLEKFVDALSKLPEGAQTAVVGFGIFLAAIGPVLSGLGSMVTLVKTLASKLSALGTAVSSVGSALGSIATFFASFAAWGGMTYLVFDEMADTFNNAVDRERKKVYDKNKAIYMNEMIGLKEFLSGMREAKAEYERELQLWEDGGKKKVGYDTHYQSMLYAWEKWRAITDAWNERRESFESNKSTSPVVAEDVVDANTELQRELGLIEQLEQRLAKLREQQAQATDIAQLDKINAEIKLINDELERLRNFNAEDFYKWSEHRNAGGIAIKGVSFGVSGPKMAPLEKSLDIDAWKEQFLRMSDEMLALVNSLNSALSNAFASLASAMGEGIEAAITGDEFKPMQRLMLIIGDMLKQMGAALVAYATALEAFKEAWKNPWVALGAGLAAIAAGSVITGLAKRGLPKLAQGGLAYGPTIAVVGDNPGAANDPEVVAPLSKLRDYMGGQKLELTGDIQWEMRGDTLRAVLDRNNIRIATLG